MGDESSNDEKDQDKTKPISSCENKITTGVVAPDNPVTLGHNYRGKPETLGHNYRDRTGRTPFHRGAFSQRRDMVAPDNHVMRGHNYRGRTGEIPFHRGALNQRCDMVAPDNHVMRGHNYRGRTGETPFHRGAFNQRRDMAAPDNHVMRGHNYRGRTGETPFHRGAFNQRRDMAAPDNHVMRGYNYRGRTGETPFYRGAFNQRRDMAAPDNYVTRGHNYRGRTGRTPFYRGAFSQRRDMVAPDNHVTNDVVTQVSHDNHVTLKHQHRDSSESVSLEVGYDGQASCFPENEHNEEDGNKQQRQKHYNIEDDNGDDGDSGGYDDGDKGDDAADKDGGVGDGDEVAVLVQITLPASMDWNIVQDELRHLTRNVKFNLKGEKSRNPHKDTFCISFPNRKQAKSAMYLIKKGERNQIKAVFCETHIQTCQEKISQEIEIALSSHSKKLEEVTQTIMAFQKENTKKTNKTKFYNVEDFEKLDALKETAKELNGQTKEFVDLTNELVQRLESLKNVCDGDLSANIKNIEQQFQREKERLSNALPIYAEKSRIVEAIKENQVCIILGETGSGKSTQIVQYLYDAGFAERKTIVCTQPRKVAAFSLAKRVSEELQSSKLVDCMYTNRRRKSSILFTTDHSLLMKCLQDQDLSPYSCVVIDEAHERNINTDLLLGIIKKALARRPDLRVVVTSATIDPKLFQEYFGFCPVIRVSGKLFPVEVEMKKHQPGAKLSSSSDYVLEAVDKVVEIQRGNEEGDVLVFLTCPAEIDKACNTLLRKVNTSDIICLPLHGKLQQDEQLKVFEPTPPRKRKVVFSTNCAETSLTIPGIKFVIDSGRAKEMKYDQKRNLSSLDISIISQSSANQRKGRAGRTDSGKCFRLYTEEEFNAMEKSSKPEILRVHLGQALLKLMELGISNPADFDYVESPPLESIKAAMAELEELEATKEGKLTDLGKNIARVPVDPRLGKFLFEGLNQNVGYEALVLVSISTITGSVFFRMGSEEEKKTADDKKIEFCQLGGDLMTLLHVFRKWLDVDERDRGRWCFDKRLNAKAMRMANETVKDLKMVLKRDLKIDGIQWAEFDQETTDRIIQKTLFTCFLTKLCVFTGHEKAGYQTVIGGHYVKVHPSSAVKFMGKYPKFVVYEKILKTTQDFILNVTPIEEDWLRETITDPSLLGTIQQLVDEMMVKRTIMCSRSLIEKSLLPPKEKIPDIEKRVSLSSGGKLVILEVDRKTGHVDLFVSSKCATKGEEIVQCVLEDGRNKLREQTGEFQVEGARSLQVVIQSGLTVQQLLMPGMYRTVFVPQHDQDLIDLLHSLGKVIDISSNRQKQLFVTYETPEQAQAAVNCSRDSGYQVHPRTDKQQQQKERSNYNFVVNINWLRREPKGMAKVTFATDPSPWLNFPSGWSRNIDVLSKTARVTADKFQMDSIFINGLHPSSTKREIKDALHDVFPDEDIQDSNINIQYKQREMRRSISSQTQKTVLENLIKLNETDNFEVSIKQIPPDKDKCPFGNAQVRFASPNEGMVVAKQLHNTVCKGLESWQVILEVRPKLDFYYTSLKSVYDLVKVEVSQQIDQIAEECQVSCREDLRLKESSLGKEASGSRVKLSVETKCIHHYVRAASTITTAIQGEVFDCTKPPERSVLLSPAAKDKLTSIQRETGTIICPDTRKLALVIYGTRSQKNKAFTALEQFVLKLVLNDSSEWKVHLKGPNKPRGLLKQIMAAFGCEFERLCEIEGVVQVGKCLFKHVLTIQSTKEAKEEVLRRIEEIERAMPRQPRLQGNHETIIEECPICICEVEDAYRLSTCGHAHCNGCIKEQLKSATFPMVCAVDNCVEKLALKDMQNLLRLEKDHNDMIKKAIDSYVETNNDKARFCPSPDCPMIYLVSTEGKPFQCKVCSTTTCTSCHKAYHLGMTCKEYEIEIKDPGAVDFQKWMEEMPNRRKRCPKCERPIEKNEGCNHMTCSGCNCQFCWMCLQAFPSGGHVYDHQSSCPGRLVQ